jgi:hypothetical protein
MQSSPFTISIKPISERNEAVNSDRNNKLDKLDNDFSSSPSQQVSCWALYGGILMALSASIFFSSSFLIIKILEPRGLKPYGAALLFNLGVIIPCSILIILNEFGLEWRKRKRVLQGIWPINKESFLGFMAVNSFMIYKHLKCFLKCF